MGGHVVYVVYGVLAGAGALLVALGAFTAHDRYEAAKTRLHRVARH